MQVIGKAVHDDDRRLRPRMVADVESVPVPPHQGLVVGHQFLRNGRRRRSCETAQQTVGDLRPTVTYGFAGRSARRTRSSGLTVRAWRADASVFSDGSKSFTRSSVTSTSSTSAAV